MNKNIDKIVKELFSQASTGKIVIGNPQNNNSWKFYTKFFTKIEGQKAAQYDGSFPLLSIPNYEKFLKSVEGYLDISKSFYAQDKEYFDFEDSEFEKKLILDLLVNASVEDLDSITKFIAEKTNILICSQKFLSRLKLNDKPMFSKFDFNRNFEVNRNLFLGNYDADGKKTKIYTDIFKNHSSIEAPLVFQPYFLDENESVFCLPAVVFGLGSDNNGKWVYVGAVQNFKTNQEEKFAKKMDRFLRKVNSGVEENSIEANVSPKAVVSLVLFSQFSNAIQAQTMFAKSYLPLRNISKVESVSNRGNLTDNDRMQEFEKIDKDQFNITNKFMYLFARINHHFPSANVEFDEFGCIIQTNLEENSSDHNIIQDIAKNIKENYLAGEELSFSK